MKKSICMLVMLVMSGCGSTAHLISENREEIIAAVTTALDLLDELGEEDKARAAGVKKKLTAVKDELICTAGGEK